MYKLSKIICITNRHICRGDFLSRIEEIAKLKPRAIILREKDLDELSYFQLASKVNEICKECGVNFIPHTFANTALKLSLTSIHLPLSVLEQLPERDRVKFSVIGSSCHSLSEVEKAKDLGATYATLGHIFETECKRNLSPKGLGLLRDVSENSNLPIFALGGINHKNLESVIGAGASGVCIMSGFMQCDNIHEYIKNFID